MATKPDYLVFTKGITMARRPKTQESEVPYIHCQCMFSNLILVHEILHYRKFSSTKSLLQYLFIFFINS